jgi:hypothetical protein
LARQKAVRLSDHELSRLYNSADGNFDQVVSRPGAAPYLERRTRTEAVGVAGAAQVWTGKHTWVQVERAELEAAVISFRRAYEALAPGAARCTAASVLLDVRSRGPEADYVRKHGRLLGRWNDRGTLLGTEEMPADGGAVYQLGRAGFDLPSSVGLSDEQIEAALDETDERTVPISAEEKKALSYSYMEVRPDAWRERGYPEHHELMSKGAVTQMSEPIPARLHLPNYAEKQKGDNWCIAEEMVRSGARGAIRWAKGEEAHFIHPWVVVHTEPEGKPKVRACGDYSAILNKHDTASWPFSMPRVWDLRQWVTKDSYFAKFDLSDGFWAVPISESHTKYFGYRMPYDTFDPETGARHPKAGCVALATRLPFGWAASPALFQFCTAAVAENLRIKHGIKCLAYCDDFILVGGREELKRHIALFEEEMRALGLVLAPHKKDGPCRSLKFLGLRVTNVPGERSISLPQDKKLRLFGMMRHYREHYRAGDRVAPQQLAKLLGLLNFASQVVDGGETFLTRMYSSFRGCVVDWKRGLVRVGDGTRPMRLTEEFFRDLDWWQENLEWRNAVPLLPRIRGPPVILGTDASDQASGGLTWLSGDREETKHGWSSWERSQPINFRELAGSVHLIEQWGPRLRGRLIIIETDNMAAMHCIRRRRARTEAMAEQLRRLYALAARYDLEIRVIHTSGVDLVRPDAVSRDRTPKAPRQRFVAGEWAELSRIWGPFHKGIGAEMEHRNTPASTPQDRTWYHPDHSTVVSTLKEAWEEVARSRIRGDALPPVSVIVLPDWEAAKWQSLVDRQKMRPIRQWAEGEACLEEWRGFRAGWVRVRTQSASTAYLFPCRAAGADSILAAKECAPRVGDRVALFNEDASQFDLYLCTDDALGVVDRLLGPSGRSSAGAKEFHGAQLLPAKRAGWFELLKPRTAVEGQRSSFTEFGQPHLCEVKGAFIVNALTVEQRVDGRPGRWTFDEEEARRLVSEWANSDSRRPRAGWAKRRRAVSDSEPSPPLRPSSRRSATPRGRAPDPKATPSPTPTPTPRSEAVPCALPGCKEPADGTGYCQPEHAYVHKLAQKEVGYAWDGSAPLRFRLGDGRVTAGLTDACLICGNTMYGQQARSLELDAAEGMVHADPCAARLGRTAMDGWRSGPTVNGLQLVDQPISCVSMRPMESVLVGGTMGSCAYCCGPTVGREVCVVRVRDSADGLLSDEKLEVHDDCLGKFRQQVEKRVPQQRADGQRNLEASLRQYAEAAGGPAPSPREDPGEQTGTSRQAVDSHEVGREGESGGGGSAEWNVADSGEPLSDKQRGKKALRAHNDEVLAARQVTRKVIVAEQTEGQQLERALSCFKGCCGKWRANELLEEDTLIRCKCGTAIHAECVGVGGARLLRAQEEGWTCIACAALAAYADLSTMEVEKRAALEGRLMSQQLAELKLRLSTSTATRYSTVGNHLTSFYEARGLEGTDMTPARLALFGDYLGELGSIKSVSTVTSYLQEVVRMAVGGGWAGDYSAYDLMHDPAVTTQLKKLSGSMGSGTDGATPLNSAFAQHCLEALEDQPSKFCASRASAAFVEGRFGSGRSMDVLGGKAVGWQASNTDIYDGTAGDMPACVGVLMGGGKNSDEEQRMIMPAITLGTKTKIAERILHHTQLWGIHTDYDKNLGRFTFDSYYLRINLAGMQGKTEDVACIEAAIGECPYVAKCVGMGDRKEMVADLKDRAKHKQADKHWAPLAIGRKADMQEAAAEWGERLLASGKKMDVSVVPAPMLRNTFGRGKRPGLTPWDYSTMENEFSSTFANVYEKLKARGDYAALPTVERGQLIKLTTHSMRRGADAEAVELQGKSQATDDDINMVFRWKLKELNAEMRTRYRGALGARLKLRVNEHF